MAACSEPEPSTPAPVEDASPEPPSEPEPPATPTDVGDEVIEEVGDVPTEPLVRLVKAGKGAEETLPARAPGTMRSMVVEARITEGAKKRLDVPVVRLAGDVVLDGIDDAGSRYRWTPRATEVLVSGDGVDPEFLTRFEAALAPGEAPKALPMVADRWDAITDLGWPASEDPHAQRVGAALRLALGHLAMPLHAFTINEGTRWEVRRQVDLWGIPTWETVICTAEKIDGPQLKRIHAAKTGALIRGSVRCEAIVAGASAEQLRQLTVYGEKIGLVFQITDDILDHMEDPEAVSYPALFGLEESRRMAAEAVQEALSNLEPFGEAAEPLRALATYLLTRTS